MQTQTLELDIIETCHNTAKDDPYEPCQCLQHGI